MRPSDSDVIDRLGGPTAVARMVKTTPQAVSQWRASGIPDARRQYLELLRPDAFSETLEPADTTTHAGGAH